MVIFQRQKSSVNLKKKTKKRRVLNMNKNAATEREYEFSYDTLVDIITAQQALIEELTHTIFAKEKELEKKY